ncbi:MT-A70-domain-containing protein [Daldinia caldariorum]|uniref:MT-A70-domain-containing protein n=1 Tax=Daldinia caldariorum TaxID=326644 RepID=UPI002007A16F|nr:MT-A70-domain-containing protein [Daldinia caldariorum]KAI1470725.1 MT-A70-domain-containing protein [Daldinia caldariorum]
MSSKTDSYHFSESCVLYESPDRSIVLIDIPHSIEEAQLLPGQIPKQRIISCSPIETPWKIPEPKKKSSEQLTTPSASIAELMTQEAVRSALEKAKLNYKGLWCLPRVVQDAGELCDDKSYIKESQKRKRTTDTPADVIPESLIPDQSHYLLGTIESRRGAFIADAPMFDLIVLDPPWPSRSVKRKQNSYTIAYNMQEVRDLLTHIPIASHLKSDGIVAVWVTNKPAVTDLLTSPHGIFSEWGLELVGEWTWLKITSSGDPVIDLEAQWRKPWERLLLGRKRSSRVKTPIPNKVTLGVPDIHSRKPNLRRLFQGLLPENYIALEVFARNLTAGWWGWGSEVLYFQQGHHWVDIPDDVPTKV